MSRKLGLGGVKPLVVLAPNKWTSEDDKTITWKRTENLGSDNLVFGYHHLLPFIPSNPNEPNDTHYNKSEYSNDKTHVFSPGTYSLDKHGFAICAMTEQPIKLKKFKNIIIEFQEWINDVSKLDGVIELWPETEYSNLENNEYKYYPILTKDEIAEKENDLIVINTASGFNTASGKRILLIRPKEKKDNNEMWKTKSRRNP